MTNRKSFIILIIVIMLLTGYYLLNRYFSIYDKVVVYKTVNFEEVIPNSMIVFTDKKQIEIFQKAVKTAKRNSGIADVRFPDYKFEMGEKAFYLWLVSDQGQFFGSIMNEKETHYLFKLSTDSARNLTNLLEEMP